jgi:cell division protein FtsL
MALSNRSIVAEPYRQPAPRETTQKQTSIKRRKRFSKQEGILYLGFIIALAIMAIVVLHKQGEIQTATLEIQKMERSINDISIKNVDYKVQISEKSTFDRIMAIAKERGLALNEKNVKVVPGE